MTTGDRPGLRLGRFDPLVPLWVVVTVVVWGSYGLLGGLRRDAGLYAYAGQLVADGEPPYVGVMNRTGPISHLLPGLGVALGRATGLGDVPGARLVGFALAVLTPALAYLLTREAFRSRLAGCAAAAVILSFVWLARLAVDGPESKVPMVVLLSAALLFTLQRRMLLAGIFAGLATLAWQPVLFAAGAAALVMAVTTPGGRRAGVGAAARYAVGGLATLAVAVCYFLAVGAVQPFFDSFWRATAGYTVQTGLLDHPEHVAAMLGNRRTWPLLAGCALSLGLAAWALVGHPPGADREWRRRALAVGAASAVGIGWSLLAYNRMPDTLLLLPSAAAGVGAGTAVLVALAARSRWSARVLVGVVTALVLLAGAGTLHHNVTARDTRLEAERDLARGIFDALPADATAMSIEAPQPLVLAGRRSISRYQIFAQGIPMWIEDEWPGGRQGYVDWLREQAPTVVFLTHRPPKPFLRPFLEDYRQVGNSEHGWRIRLHRSLPRERRQAVAEVVERAKASGSLQRASAATQ